MESSGISGVSNLELAIMNFNFQKVHTIMTIMGWTWNGEEDAPSVSQMKNLVIDLHDALEDNNDWCSSGGFRVERNEKGVITILFILEESDSTW